MKCIPHLDLHTEECIKQEMECGNPIKPELKTKKYAVYYKLPNRPETYIHIFHSSAEGAALYCTLEGVGYDGREKVTVTSNQITKVEEVIQCG